MQHNLCRAIGRCPFDRYVVIAGGVETFETDLLVQRLKQEMFTLDHLLYRDDAIMDVEFFESIHSTSHQARVVLVF